MYPRWQPFWKIAPMAVASKCISGCCYIVFCQRICNHLLSMKCERVWCTLSGVVVGGRTGWCSHKKLFLFVKAWKSLSGEAHAFELSFPVHWFKNRKFVEQIYSNFFDHIHKSCELAICGELRERKSMVALWWVQTFAARNLLWNPHRGRRQGLVGVPVHSVADRTVSWWGDTGRQ